MAGHSHAKNVKRTKEANAKKRAFSFAKIGKTISFLAKQGGGDISANSSLRTAIEKAREMNVPKNNIEKAIKRGTGEISNENQLEEFIFEAYGPGGVAIIAEGITDNKNRSMMDFKNIILQYGGKIAEMGSVKWLFKKKELIVVSRETENDNLELTAIEAGSEDIKIKNNYLEIVASLEKSDIIKKELNERGFKFELFLVWIPNVLIEVKEHEHLKVKEMLQKLEEEEDVQEVFLNIKE